MMSTFETNVAALRKLFPALADRVAATTPPNDFEIEASRSTAPTARRGRQYLHSRYAPEREASRIAERLIDHAADCYVIYGLGLGYVAEALLQITTSESVVVVEADMRMIAGAFAARSLTGVLTETRLHLMVGPSPAELMQFLSNLQARRPIALGLPAVTGADYDYYHNLEQARRRYVARQEVNSNTLQRFGRRWVRNLTANAGRLATARRVAELAGSLADIPALVCAGGPSLDEVLAHMSEISTRAVIIAVDTAVPPLMRNGVEPDFIVVVDPQYWNTRHLDNLKLDHGIVVGESATHPRSFRVLDRPTFLCSSLFPLGRFLETARAPFGSLGTGGSVTTTAWDFARHLGADPIYLAGMDLGYPAFRTHVSGSLFEERSHTISHRLRPAETLQVSYIEGGRPYYTDAADGTQVLTDQRMAVYRDWFSLQQELPYPGARPRTYTMSPRGVRIDGLLPAAVSDILEHKPRRKEISTAIHAVLSAPGDTTSVAQAAIADRMARLIGDLERAEELAWEARESAGSDHPDTAARRPEAIDEELQKLESKDIIGFLLESVATELSTSAPRTYQDAVDNSRRLYEAIAESAAFHRRMLTAAQQSLSEGGSRYRFSRTEHETSER